MVGRWVGIGLVGVFLGCEGEPPRQLGVCEQLWAQVAVSTADGSASIAKVETTGVCAPSTGWCEATGDHGGSEMVCTSVNVVARAIGGCDLVIVSTLGQRISSHVDFRTMASDQRCQTSVGQVIDQVPVLVAEPREMKVEFALPDGGLTR
jgi:hypothetical protein